jgi:hypothetical protein
VERGKADGQFITTSGIDHECGIGISVPQALWEGDVVLVNG